MLKMNRILMNCLVRFFNYFFDVFVYVVNNLIFVSKINRNGKNGSSLKYIGMKYIRLLLCIGG